MVLGNARRLNLSSPRRRTVARPKKPVRRGRKTVRISTLVACGSLRGLHALFMFDALQRRRLRDHQES